MADIYDNVSESNFRSEAVSTLHRLNRLIDKSSDESPEIKELINKLEILKFRITSSNVISRMQGRRILSTEMSEDSILIANIDDAVHRAENPIKRIPTERIKFSGNPVEWFKFLETFEKTVHDRKNISDAAKFECLKSMVEGLPFETIKSLPVTDNSYLIALDLLKETFKNEKVLIEAHIYALCDLESPTAMPESLSKFRSEFEYHIRALNAYEPNFEECSGFIIVEILKRKLPKEIQNNISKANKDLFWSLSKFVNALRREIGSLAGHENANETSKFLLNSVQDEQGLTLQPRLNNGTREQKLIPSLASNNGPKAQKPILTKSNNSTKGQKSIPTLVTNNGSKEQEFIPPTVTNNGSKEHEFIPPLMSIQSPMVTNSDSKEHEFIPPLMSIQTQYELNSGPHWQNTVPSFMSIKTPKNDLRNYLVQKRSAGEKGIKNRDRGKKVKKDMDSSPDKTLNRLFPCNYCESAHFNPNCPMYKTPTERRSRAAELHLCLHCLSSSHLTRACTLKLKCKCCGGRHVYSLCFRKEPRQKKKTGKDVKKKK